jgi:glycosyltransferase involved in cell wall biosynthesis
MLRGDLNVSRDAITGWAQESDHPDAAISLLVTDNGELVARVLANQYRGDLDKASIGNGRHAFAVSIPAGLSPLTRHVIRVSREEDGADIWGSPQVLEPAVAFDEATERSLERMLADAGSDAELTRRIDFLVVQTDKLLQLRADHQSNRTRRSLHKDLRTRWSRHLPAVVTQVCTTAEQSELSPRALVIDDRMPLLERDAGSNAILSHMGSLHRLGYDVAFVGANMLPDAESGSDAMQTMGITVLSGPHYASVEEVLRRHHHMFDLVYIHRVSNCSKYLSLVRHHVPKARIVCNIADLHHLRLERQATVEHRPELLELSRRVRFAEFVAVRSADVVITHSNNEADLLRAAVSGANVHVLAWSVPTRPRTVEFAKRAGVAFIGGYEHPPNVDAARWLMDEIMPLVQLQNPEIECLLVGSNMPDDLLRMSRKGIVPVGYIKDLKEIFDRVRLTVAPLRYGAGLKGKVIESLAAGLPCVCTSIAAEGFALPELLADHVADEPKVLAQLICHLHESSAANDEWALAGLQCATRQFSKEGLDRLLKAAIGPIM